jgi:hypothetical protein
MRTSMNMRRAITCFVAAAIVVGVPSTASAAAPTLGITATANGASVAAGGCGGQTTGPEGTGSSAACPLRPFLEGALPVGPGSRVDLNLEWPAVIADAILINANPSEPAFSIPVALAQQGPVGWTVTLPSPLPAQPAMLYFTVYWERDGYSGYMYRAVALTAPGVLVSAQATPAAALATLDLLAPARVEGVLTRRGAPQAAPSRRTQRPRRRPRPTLPTVLGRTTISTTGPGATAIKVPLSNTAKRALSAYRRVPVMLTLITTTADGSQTTLQRRLWIQRGAPKPPNQ